MECVEARALKSSFSSELAMKTTNTHSIIDDFWCMTGLPSDDFSIDEFFDLPNEDEQQQQQQEHEEHEDNIYGSSFLEEEEEKDSSFSLSSHEAIDDSNSNSTNFSPDLLSIPVDDVQELELWSHLMDDSIPEPTLACPNPILDGQKMKTGFSFMNRVEPVEKPVRAHPRMPPFIPSAVPVKPRTKRSRSTGNRSWGLASPESSSTLLFDMAPPRISDLGLLFAFGKPMAKKPKKPKKRVDDNDVPVVQRRCSHCQVTKTPQWRAGPNGPKTLCNACGVRFKSGRLFPEYRPACSPTFSSEVHSNSHRKVLEMRKKKEGTESSVPVPGSMILAA